MNVLLLPDEMLASVLKYIRFENLTEFRKVSSKIDSVARRYGLHKWKIDRLTIDYRKTEVRLMMDLVPKVIKEFTRPPSTDLLSILKYIFAAVCYALDAPNGIVSNEVGEFLLGKDCKNITWLMISGCDISIKFNTMRNIMTKLKLKKLYLNASFTEFDFSDTVIEGIPFKSLMLINKMGDRMKLTLPYLSTLCTIKIPSFLNCEIKNSTVADLITFFKLWTKDMMRNVVDWHIGISEKAMSADENEIWTLECFEDHSVRHLNNGEITWYYIRKCRN